MVAWPTNRACSIPTPRSCAPWPTRCGRGCSVRCGSTVRRPRRSWPPGWGPTAGRRATTCASSPTSVSSRTTPTAPPAVTACGARLTTSRRGAPPTSTTIPTRAAADDWLARHHASTTGRRIPVRRRLAGTGRGGRVRRSCRPGRRRLPVGCTQRYPGDVGRRSAARRSADHRWHDALPSCRLRRGRVERRCRRPNCWRRSTVASPA